MQQLTAIDEKAGKAQSASDAERECARIRNPATEKLRAARQQITDAQQEAPQAAFQAAASECGKKETKCSPRDSTHDRNSLRKPFNMKDTGVCKLNNAIVPF